MDVIHAAMWVADIDRTLAFYVDGLGLERTVEFVGDDGATNLYVAGDDGTELQFKYRADGGGPDVEPAGIDHVAVSVEDVDSELDRLVERTGCPVRRGPSTVEATNARVAFVEDPDGYGVELVQPLD